MLRAVVGGAHGLDGELDVAGDLGPARGLAVALLAEEKLRKLLPGATLRTAAREPDAR